MNPQTKKHLHVALPKWIHPFLFMFMPGIYFTHKMATDPRWQFAFNAFFSVIWLVVMVVVPQMSAFRHDHFSALLIMEVSLWANFISHYGALGGNVAAIIASNISNAETSRLERLK